LSNLCSENSILNEYLTIKTGTLHEDVRSFLVMASSVRLTINVRSKDVVKNKTRILYSITFLKMCLYELVCENMSLSDMSQISMLSLAFSWHSDRPSWCKNVQHFVLYIYIFMYTHKQHTHTYIYTHTLT